MTFLQAKYAAEQSWPSTLARARAAASVGSISAAVLASVAKTGCVVTAEEHNRLGGLGDSIAQLLAVNNPSPQEYVAVNDSFGESGTPEELMKKYGLDSDHIVSAALRAIARKMPALKESF